LIAFFNYILFHEKRKKIPNNFCQNYFSKEVLALTGVCSSFQKKNTLNQKMPNQICWKKRISFLFFAKKNFADKISFLPEMKKRKANVINCCIFLTGIPNLRKKQSVTNTSYVF
jgi:hypothetical protein